METLSDKKYNALRLYLNCTLEKFRKKDNIILDQEQREDIISDTILRYLEQAEKNESLLNTFNTTYIYACLRSQYADYKRKWKVNKKYEEHTKPILTSYQSDVLLGVLKIDELLFLYDVARAGGVKHYSKSLASKEKREFLNKITKLIPLYD